MQRRRPVDDDNEDDDNDEDDDGDGVSRTREEDSGVAVDVVVDVIIVLLSSSSSAAACRWRMSQMMSGVVPGGQVWSRSRQSVDRADSGGAGTSSSATGLVRTSQSDLNREKKTTLAKKIIRIET